MKTKKRFACDRCGKNIGIRPRKYYAWVGQNATTGTPNRITGRMSMYGQNYVFDSQEDRDEFVICYHDPNGNNHAEGCTYRQLRGKNLGCSVAMFKDVLDHCDNY